MNRTISTLLTLGAGALFSTSVFAVSLNGIQWQTIDDKTGEKKLLFNCPKTVARSQAKSSRCLIKRRQMPSAPNALVA